jgi:Dolichyl-phosphate-mannose-protein mannosyltransferase
MNHSGRRLLQIFPIILIVAACFVRVVVCFQHNPMDYVFSDMSRHWQNGLTFPRGGYTGAADPIMYQIYISCLRRISGDNRFLVALISSLLSLAMPWTYYRAARNFGMPKTAALWVWALIAATPSLFTMYHYIVMETLLLFLEGFAFWMTARYLREGGTRPYLSSVVAWTLASLTKPTVVPLAVVCVLWSWWKKCTPFRDIAVGFAVSVALLVPQAVRTKVELGFIAPFGNPWLTRIQHRSGAKTIHLDFRGPYHDNIGQEYASPTCFIRPMWPLSSWAIRRGFTSTVTTVSADYKHGSHDWSDAFKALNVTREEWLAQWRENILVTLFAPSWPETTSHQWDSRLEFYSRWIWTPLICFVLIGNLLVLARGHFELIPIAVSLTTLAIVLQNVITAEGRYRKPIEPLLLLNLVWLIVNWKRRRATVESPMPVEQND